MMIVMMLIVIAAVVEIDNCNGHLLEMTIDPCSGEVMKCASQLVYTVTHTHI